MKNHSIQRLMYNALVVPVMYGLLPAAARLNPKLREVFAGRRDIRRRWLERARQLGNGRPVWFHVSSVGEYEQASPVINSLGKRFPKIPVAVTFSSPSGLGYAMNKERHNGAGNIKFIDYLPMDSARNARFCLATLNPRLLVFVKFDLWPNLIWEARTRGTTAILIDATLSENSQRYRALGKRFYRAVYSDLDRILAISEEDARRFSVCVPNHGGISIAGDTRFDRVMERKQAHRKPMLAAPNGARIVIMAGSTWPKDESHLLPALERLASTEKNLLLVIAPHEPLPARVAELTRWAKSHGMETATWSARDSLSASSTGTQALIVDTVGVLAEAYSMADVVYVGGSFSSGVHSVIEPAVMGAPVLFGPLHRNSFEAIQLLERNAAFAVHNSAQIWDTVASLIRDRDGRVAMGGRARDYVESQCGATVRCMETIADYVTTLTSV